MMNRYMSRKFLLALLSLTIASVALFCGLMDGGTWVAASSLSLGLYGASNVIARRNG